jgi:secondary thiamine-phosphate synthase enzyme
MNGNDFVIGSNRICWDACMFTRTIQTRTKHESDVIDLTEEVKSAVKESGIKTGLVHLFVQHSTAALTTIEFEPGVLLDLKHALSVLAPDTTEYAHDSRWGDGNGRSHVKAALVGPSLTIPIENGNLLCGTWQQIVLLELDVNAGRERTIVCTVNGE